MAEQDRARDAPYSGADLDVDDLGAVERLSATGSRDRREAAGAIESLNYQLRKIIKNRGHFPNDDAVIKLLWLAIRDIEDKRARQRAKEKNRPRNERKPPGKLVEGAAVQGWTQALNALAIAYPGRLPEFI